MTVSEWVAGSFAISTAASLVLLAVWEIAARVQRHRAHERARRRVLRDFAPPKPTLGAGESQ